MKTTLAVAAGIVLALITISKGQEPPAVKPTSKLRVWVGQIGYRPDARKLLVVAGDEALPELPGPVLELVNAKTDSAVWKLADHPQAHKIFNGNAKDKELSIPESGNRAPDLADEMRYSIEWFLRMADETGAAYGRMYIPVGCPPSKRTRPCQLPEQTSDGTMNRLAVLASALVVWTDNKLDPAFAKRCMDESLKAWKLLEAKPHPWPADPKDPKKLKYTGEWFFPDYHWSRAMAAVCYFHRTGEPKWHDIVKAAGSDAQLAWPIQGRTSQRLGEIARRHGVWTSAAILEKAPGGAYD